MELQIAAALAAASKKISKIETELTLENIEDFQRVESDPIYVRGLQWKLILTKEKKGEELFLRAALHSLNDDELNRLAVIASLTINIASQNKDNKLQNTNSGILFNSRFKKWTCNIQIPWKTFADPLNGYVVNNTSTVKLTLQVGELLDTSKNELLKCETIRKCCDEREDGVFRMTVNKINTLFGVSTSEFRLGGISWYVMLFKNAEIEQTSSLAIKLMSADVSKSTDCLSCEVAISCKLISFDRDIQPVTATSQKWIYKGTFSSNALNIIRWSDLIKPKNRFIQNDSCVIEIEIKITDLKRITKQAVKRPASDDVVDVKIKCRICSKSLVGRVLSSTSCGHVFHTQCIREKLRGSKSCPKCQARTLLGDLRMIDLETE